MWIDDILTLVTIAVTIIAIIMLYKGKIKKLKSIKITAERTIYRNVSNNWISPNIKPLDNEASGLMPVIVTIQNINGKKFVQDAYFDPLIQKFRGLTPDFNDKVIAWMPYPEPYSNNALNKNDESGKAEEKN